jgi:hypothetical protein
MVIWYIFPRFGTLYQEKSGNLGWNSELASKSNFDVFASRELKTDTRDLILAVVELLQRDAKWREFNRVARWHRHVSTKNPNLGKIGRVLQLKMFVYFIAIWTILRLFYGYLVYFPPFGNVVP